jgi:hypothetical protein
VVLVLLAAAVTVLPGCTGGPDIHAQPTPSRASPAAGLPPGVVNATAVPTAVPNNSGARKNVTLSSCKASKDGWQASGTATNPRNKEKRYTITVFFTTAGGTVIGTGQTAVNVESGAQRSWNVKATFHRAPDTRCVLAGVS